MGFGKYDFIHKISNTSFALNQATFNEPKIDYNPQRYRNSKLYTFTIVVEVWEGSQWLGTPRSTTISKAFYMK